MTGPSCAVQVECLPVDFDLLRLHESNPERYPHLLESVIHGSAQARYDILFAFPGQTLSLADDGSLQRPAGLTQGEHFLDCFDAWWRSRQCAPDEVVALPFRGGWFVYLAYELAAEIEPTLHLPRFRNAWPVAVAQRFPAAVIRDHQTARVWLLAESDRATVLDMMRADIAGLGEVSRNEDFQPVLLSEPVEEPVGQYLAAVERIKEYILDGDVFQVNLSRAWQGRIEAQVTHAQIYRALRRTNPAPFAALVTFAERAVISSSPERLVRVDHGRISTRPIAGTRPRGVAVADDQALSAELLAHPKEQAEHVMLIDLERNDLGRVSEAGSVEVDEFMALESYAHVHHIVSNVRGRLRAGTTPGQVIRAVFPGGTITGCPKVRCMEIIAELEQEGRGAYTGSLGFINRDGDMDLNILIRSLVRDGGNIQWRAGAGIVADSIPAAELEETRAKARGLGRVFVTRS